MNRAHPEQPDWPVLHARRASKVEVPNHDTWDRHCPACASSGHWLVPRERTLTRPERRLQSRPNSGVRGVRLSGVEPHFGNRRRGQLSGLPHLQVGVVHKEAMQAALTFAAEPEVKHRRGWASQAG